MAQDADDYYIDLFRLIRAAGKSDREKAAAAANYVACQLSQSHTEGWEAAIEAAARVANHQGTISGCKKRRTKRMGLVREPYFTEITQEIVEAIRSIPNPSSQCDGDLGEGE